MTDSIHYSLPLLNAHPQVKNRRLFYVDLTRCIALFLTVFAHLYSADSKVRLYVYAFHMPLFFLLSGYLHKDFQLGDLVRKVMRRLLVPFTFFMFLGYLYFVVSSRNLRPDIILGSIRGIILGKSILANDILWFLLALFFVKVIGNLFILYPQTAGVPTLLLFVLFNFSKHNWLYLGSAFMALPFYLIGHYGKKIIQSVCQVRYRLLLAGLLLSISALLSSFNGKVSMMATVFGNTGNGLLDIILFYLNALVGSLSIMCLSASIPSFGHLVCLIATSSISIVGLHFGVKYGS